jgi:hypothetical protein
MLDTLTAPTTRAAPSAAPADALGDALTDPLTHGGETDPDPFHDVIQRINSAKWAITRLGDLLDGKPLPPTRKLEHEWNEAYQLYKAWGFGQDAGKAKAFLDEIHAVPGPTDARRRDEKAFERQRERAVNVVRSVQAQFAGYRVFEALRRHQEAASQR